MNKTYSSNRLHKICKKKYNNRGKEAERNQYGLPLETENLNNNRIEKETKKRKTLINNLEIIKDNI